MVINKSKLHHTKIRYPEMRKLKGGKYAGMSYKSTASFLKVHGSNGKTTKYKWTEEDIINVYEINKAYASVKRRVHKLIISYAEEHMDPSFKSQRKREKHDCEIRTLYIW